MLLATLKWRDEFGVEALTPERVRPNGETGERACNQRVHSFANIRHGSEVTTLTRPEWIPTRALSLRT